jgi:ribosome-associated protein
MLIKASLNICGDTGIKVTLIALNNIDKPWPSFHAIIITLMDKIIIPFSELHFSYSRSSGAGGQNVNKLNTKVTMYWDMNQTIACSPSVLDRFKEKFAQFILDDGTVQIVGQKHRSQKANMDDCIERLHAMINEVRLPPKIRKKTKPKRSAVLKRLNSKKKDSEKKRLRKNDY